MKFWEYVTAFRKNYSTSVQHWVMALLDKLDHIHFAEYFCKIYNTICSGVIPNSTLSLWFFTVSFYKLFWYPGINYTTETTTFFRIDNIPEFYTLFILCNSLHSIY